MLTLIVTATRKNFNEFHTLPLLKSLYWTQPYHWTRVESPLKNCKLHYLNESCNNFYTYCDLLIYSENSNGLSKVYNSALTHFRNLRLTKPYECIIFVHDDVSIEHPKMLEILANKFKEGYSVCGLAGTKTAQLKKPILWHLLADRSQHSGSVAHPVNGGPEYLHGGIGMTYFGPAPQRVLLIDCLFMAVKVQDLIDKNVTFDEQFDFHCVDLDFSLSCNKAGLKITTVPIWVTHQSSGLLSINDGNFQRNQELFLDKWSNIDSTK